ncbi:MAG: N-acetylglucosaminyl-diphospho-decaprenol L-rhamnosyltransferase [Microbacteriaceae bacterium]|nr:N-acetylglucosaminyl-diphospho-decaprenol L-rhamnosyltransferase [Microbacteriaceae bacterium]
MIAPSSPDSSGLYDRVAIVTVTYNSAEQLDEFLGSLEASEPTHQQVYVADNNSSDIDRVRDIARAHDATLVPLGTNKGYGGAVNSATSALPSSVDAILVVNPDVTFHDGAVRELLAGLDRHPTAGAVGPRVLEADGSTYPSARELPSLRTGVGHALFSRVWPANPWTMRYRAESDDASRERAAGWLSGSCMLVRRTAFEQLGGFDESYFMYFEDVDLGYRLRKHGWDSVYVPRAVVNHSGAHSTSRDSARMVRAHHASAYHFLSKKYSGWYLAPLRWAIGIGLSVRSTWLTHREPGR